MTSLDPPQEFRGRFATDVATRAAYSEGAGPLRIVPAAVAVPESEEDLACLVRAATAQGWGLVPRGAGSGMPGGNIGPGVVVDMRTFRRPLTVDAAARATVGAAVTWAALDAAAAPQGLRLPPNPSSGRFCTAGGMVAANAAGARSVRSGSVRRWVRAARLVTGDGEVVGIARDAPVTPSRLSDRLAVEGDALRLAARGAAVRYPRTRKNSSGYALDAFAASGDVLDLLVGAEGTLGILTEISFDLERRPAGIAGALFGLRRLEDLGTVVERLLELDPAAVELLDATFLALAGQALDAAAVLLVDFERAEPGDAREAARAAVHCCAEWCTFTEAALDPAAHARLWTLRHAASPVLAALPDSRRSLQLVEDGCVPVSMLGRYLEGVREIAEGLGVQIVAFGHAGDGHLHVNALFDPGRTEFRTQVRTLYERVTDLVIALGGTPSGEHGDGRLRADAVERLYDPATLAVFRQVKQLFDPHGVMNPGVILADSADPPLSHLKVGPDAPILPEAVARGLRRIERAGAWETSPLELLPEHNPR